ncbi:MAG: hypothetical protein MUC72_02440 [Acidobacteria bacterium]|nr:hypothetical protein [Acidobacteriota bacterium]
MDNLTVIKRLQSSAISQEELEDIQRRHKGDYRVQLHLAQHPKFPQGLALGILSKLFAVDLVRVIKNVKTNPFVRKKAELEFMQRYKRLALGEKISLLKMAPNSLLPAFIDENDPRLLQAILENPNCSEDVVLRFVNRGPERSQFYRALGETAWFQSPAVAEAIAHDPEAPIKALVAVIPYLGLSGLQKLFRDPATHQAVRERIRLFLDKRQAGR